MNPTSLYPLRFEPVFQYRLWGGRGFEKFMETELPGDGPYGEAWIMSDRDDISSIVAEGPLKGKSLPQLMKVCHADIMGSLAASYKRFPLLLKFLDCQELLSVQVHPSDSQADLLPPGENGKTEAWVVLEADPCSLIFDGLKPNTTQESLRQAIEEKSVRSLLPSFTPEPADAVFIPAGTVHTLGNGVMVFEVQENSDVTFRLYDWDRVDEKTGKPRDLHIDKGLASINFSQGIGAPVTPVAEGNDANRETLFDCKYFRVWRSSGDSLRKVGRSDEPRVLVCLEGNGIIEHHGSNFSISQGQVILLPAKVGECTFMPSIPTQMLEIAIPEISKDSFTNEK